MVSPNAAEREGPRKPRLRDEAAGPELDALIRLLAEAMDCPLAMLSLAEPDRLVPWASIGFRGPEMPGQGAFCGMALRGGGLLAVEEARAHPDFRDHPMVVAPDGIRFYMGIPLVVDGWTLGVLCALDRRPRPAGLRERETMERFALVAQSLLHAQAQQARLREVLAALRENGVQLRRQNRLFQQAAAMARLGAWELDLRNGEIYCSEVVHRLHDLPSGTPLSLAGALQFYPEHERSRIGAVMERTVKGGAPLDFEADFVSARGRRRRVRTRGEVETEQGKPVRVLGIMHDVTESWQMMERLRQLAHTDSLTGLGNRAALFERLEALRAAPPGHEAALLVLDLDGFQDLNDRHGHQEGDRVLNGVAQRLRRIAGEAGFVARTGSDEFALLMRDPGSVAAIRETAQRLVAALQARLPGEEAWRPLSASIGVARWPSDSATPLGLLRQADMALSGGRRQGKARITLFSPAIASRFQERRVAIDHVQRALSEDRLRPFYQPKMRLADGRLAGFEALVRVLEPDGTVSGPAQFWPALQEPGTAELIGVRMLGAITRDLALWRQEGLPATRIGLNVAEADMLSEGLAERVLERLHSHGLPPDALEIEVTETVFLGAHRPAMTHVLQRLYKAGLRIALDDFGTGYASLVHLRNFPIHALKIDKSFIDEVEQAGGSRLIVEMLIQLAHGLGLEVVAEGVETGGQHRLLRALGCDVGQGHHYGMALGAEAARAMLAGQRDVPPPAPG
ncbi:hypothetical protein CR162_15890 [Pseudoroseomonas rhizosphaerae]|uniref:Bifunctional diguanylate cyclase/phosphodiesterase n=1 Tax=Teichococcus rhizosphaerae TaxID=1335062 RepID=A0A2C7A973_9PROT|nr:EAL domain-containing protein [Pseudoroseomonas rhizosphaerae]PHK93905.1 hypothetical protein CR162_15890 [Pseudoroseomonas rhizosphaerae]